MNWYRFCQLVDYNTDYDVDSRSIYTRNQKEYHRDMILSYRRRIREARRLKNMHARRGEEEEADRYEDKISEYEKKISYHMDRVLYYERKEDQSHLKEKQKMRKLLNF